MAFKAKLSKVLYDALSSEQKALYKAHGDSYIIDVEAVEGWALEDVSGLRSALESERNTVATQKAALRNFDGLDPAKVKTDLARAQELMNDPTQKAITEAKIASITEQLEKKNKDILTPVQERNAFLEKQVHKTLKESAAIQAITAAKGNTKLLLPHVLAAIAVVEEGGELISRIVDEKGQSRITRKEGSHGPMEISEFVESMKSHNDFKGAFEGTQMSGGGSGTGNRGAGGSGGDFHITPEIARDFRRAEQIRTAAEKAGAQVTYGAPVSE